MFSKLKSAKNHCHRLNCRLLQPDQDQSLNNVSGETMLLNMFGDTGDGCDLSTSDFLTFAIEPGLKTIIYGLKEACNCGAPVNTNSNQ